jgi:hypothetical protein
MYDRDWLRQQVSSYLHDAKAATLIDTWIDIGAKRASQVLRCWEMESEITIGLAGVLQTGNLDGGSAAGGGVVVDGGDAFNTQVDEPLPYMDIPLSVKEILGVQWLDQEGQWRNLTALSRHASRAQKRAGIPANYLVENRRIYPYPYQAGQYRTQVIDEVVIPITSDDEIPALTSYPFIFLNAALSEAFDWKQDDTMNARYESKWFTEATMITNNYQEDRSGESLAMRAV